MKSMRILGIGALATIMVLMASAADRTVCSLDTCYAPDDVKTLKIEHTCALIKPDGVAELASGDIIRLIELNKFTILRIQKLQLSRQQAESFYAEHKGKSFFPDLIEYMTSGPIIALALEKVNGIADWRLLMGATDSTQAAVGTIRKMFGTGKTHNAVHGSASLADAQRELRFFFRDLD